MSLPCYNYVIPLPVTVSIIVISDLRVLVHKYNDNYCFPFDFMSKEDGSSYAMASKILRKCTGIDIVDYNKWLQIDVRSASLRKQPIVNKFSLDIGYAAIIDEHDEVSSKDFIWQVVNFDDYKFPLKLESDHLELWKNTIPMLELLRA